MTRPRPTIDLRALEAFVAVCETGSMTAAAKRLQVSQSAISQSIASLEREQSTELLDRESRPPRPNLAGRALLKLAEPLLKQAQDVSSKLRDTSRGETLPVRLGCVDSFAATVGPELIRAVSGSTRQIEMWSGLTPALSAQIHQREVDVVVCTQTTITDTRLVEVPLLSEAFLAVASRRWFERHKGANPEWGSLAAELPLIRYTARSVIGQQIERLARHLNIGSARHYEFDATDPLLSLVSANLGFAISTPLCLWQARHYLDTLVVFPLPRSHLSRRDFFILHRRGEWDELVDQISALTGNVLDELIRPALKKLLPQMPATALQQSNIIKAHRDKSI
ncbi:LysR family transcriptional regulator [Paraburkholderia youngii]|uniref:LysR family transcriptional regulator n=1 Tax=Paraburkholderia youngii TaxID=2782701 RepID=A0A7Y6N4L8_9BURK|nr:LysR family transcriptional regulator [Paraburkholderia youngii]NUY05551.1 LysR family transcriptional regulator [Paraburkholderia youngii]